MNRAELVACYRDRSPLRPDSKLFKEHIERIRSSSDPSSKYDQVIEEARTFYAKEKAEKIFRDRPIPDGMEDMTLIKWRRREPDGFDFELLEEASQMQHIETVEEIGRKGWKDFQRYARFLFGNEDRKR